MTTPNMTKGLALELLGKAETGNELLATLKLIAAKVDHERQDEFGYEADLT